MENPFLKLMFIRDVKMGLNCIMRFRYKVMLMNMAYK